MSYGEYIKVVEITKLRKQLELYINLKNLNILVISILFIAVYNQDVFSIISIGAILIFTLVLTNSIRLELLNNEKERDRK